MRILYIDIDSLRPDHLGCYGYTRPTSPVIDAVAARGVRFTHVLQRYSELNKGVLVAKLMCEKEPEPAHKQFT